MAKRRANGEGSIFQRKDKDGKSTGLWAAVFTDNTGKRRTIYGKTQNIVRNKLKEAQREDEKGLLVDKGKITFAAWANEWLEVYHKPLVKAGSYGRNYLLIQNHIIKGFPNILLKDLRADMLQRFFNEKAVGGRLNGREGGFSGSELHKMKSLVSRILRQAVDNNIISSNAMDKVKVVSKTKSEVEILTLDEQKRLEAVALKSIVQYSFIVIAALYTGLRLGDG